MVCRYLKNTNKFSFLQPQKAQLTVSLSCVLYLQSSLDFVDSRIAEEEKRSSILLCLHELHLYAIDHWVDHLLALSKSLGIHSGGCELEPLLQGLERLTDRHQNLANLQGSAIRNEEESNYTQREHCWQFLKISSAARSLLDRVLVHRHIVSLDESLSRESHCKHAILEDSNLLYTEIAYS